MPRQTRLALIGSAALLLVFLMLPLIAILARAAGLPPWTYGELLVSNATLVRGWALLPAWCLLGVVVLSVVAAITAASRGREDSTA
jgi:hypothetical protein